MRQVLVDLHPFIRYFDARALSTRLPRTKREAILNDYTHFFCDFYSLRDSQSIIDSDIDATINKHELNTSSSDLDIWIDMLEMVHNTILDRLKDFIELPTNGVLTVDIENGVGVFGYIDADCDKVTHDQAISALEEWMSTQQEESGHPFHNDVYKTISEYKREKGWLR